MDINPPDGRKAALFLEPGCHPITGEQSAGWGKNEGKEIDKSEHNPITVQQFTPSYLSTRGEFDGTKVVKPAGGQGIRSGCSGFGEKAERVRAALFFRQMPPAER